MLGKRWRLRHTPQGAFSQHDAELETYELGDLKDDELLVQHLYLSLDPGYRIWLSDRAWLKEYTDGFETIRAGQPLKGATLSRVIESRAKGYEPGDIILPPLSNWGDMEIVPSLGATLIRPSEGLPLNLYLGALGHTGLTAYFGMRLVGQVTAGETVLVSAAAGAVGSVAAQIARLSGARVIGITGSDIKAEWLSKECGLDAVLNRRSATFEGDLHAATDGGVNLCFDNVGGPFLDLALSAMKPYGRVVICGLIDLYEANGPSSGLARYADILMKRLTVRGFGMFDYWAQHRETALQDLTKWVQNGDISHRMDEVQGLENAPLAFSRLFSGDTSGKLVVRI